MEVPGRSARNGVAQSAAGWVLGRRESGAAGAASAAADTIDLSAGVGDGDGGGGGSIAAMGDSGRFMFGDGCQTPALADRTDFKAEERKV